MPRPFFSSQKHYTKEVTLCIYYHHDELIKFVNNAESLALKNTPRRQPALFISTMTTNMLSSSRRLILSNVLKAI